MFETDSEVPDYVPIQNRQLWRDAWNAAYQQAKDDELSDAEAEVRAYLAAWDAAVPQPEPEAKEAAVPETLKLLKYLDIFQVVDKADGTHSVIGIATSDTVDKDGERADYPGTNEAIKSWSSDFAKTTSTSGQEISLGNIRVQHDSHQIGGKVTAIEPNDKKHHTVIDTQPRKSVYEDLIKTGMVTGFSIAGSYDWRRCDECNTDISRGHFCGKCKKDVVVRYKPNISEISYVDNPCNPDSAFTHVKANGAMEILKCADLRKAAEQEHDPKPQAMDAFSSLRKELIEAGIIKEKKTKRVAGEDLAAGCFAYVGDANDPSTWKLPYKCFSTDAKNKSHVRNALARFSQTQGIPASAKAGVKAKLVAAAKKHGIEVSEKSKKCVDHAIQLVLSEHFPPTAELASKDAAATCLAKVYELFEDEVFKTDDTALVKGLYTVSQLAEILQGLQYIVASTDYERDYEGDDSEVPDDLRSALEGLIPIFIAMATEEAKELLTQNQKTATGGLGGKSMKETDADLLKAAKELFVELWKKAKSLFHKMAKEHGHLAKCMDKAAGHHENLADQHAAMCEDGADKTAKAELEKLAGGADFAKMSKADQVIARIEACEKGELNKTMKGLAKMGKEHAQLAKCMSKASGHCDNLDKAAVAVGSAEDAPDGHEESGAHGGGSEKTAAEKEAERLAKEKADKEAADKAAADKAAADALAKASGNEALAKLITDGLTKVKDELKAEIETIKADVKKQGDALAAGPAEQAKKNRLLNPAGGGREGAANDNANGSGTSLLKGGTTSSMGKAGVFGK